MRTKTIRDTRREEIITTARDLFSRKGFHGTSIPDIARAAGISTGLIYYTFSSKEDILLACSEEVAALHLDLFHQAGDIVDRYWRPARIRTVALLQGQSQNPGSEAV